MQLVICNNTKENFLREPEKINVKFHKMTSSTWNFQSHYLNAIIFSCVFTILVKFDQPSTQASSRYPSYQRRLETERDSARHCRQIFPTSLIGEVTSEIAEDD